MWIRYVAKKTLQNQQEMSMGVFNASAHHASQRKTSETEKDNIKQHMYSCVYIYIYIHTRIKIYILISKDQVRSLGNSYT